MPGAAIAAGIGMKLSPSLSGSVGHRVEGVLAEAFHLRYQLVECDALRRGADELHLTTEQFGDALRQLGAVVVGADHSAVGKRHLDRG